MAGDAQVPAVPAVSNVPPAVSAMGASEAVRESLAETGKTAARRGAIEPGRRKHHRRDLCGREKRGLGVGPTKRGKGTKITAITVGDSVPVAVSVQAASAGASADFSTQTFCWVSGSQQRPCFASSCSQLPSPYVYRVPAGFNWTHGCPETLELYRE